MFDNLTKISTISLADSGLPLFALHTESTTGEVFDYEELKKIKARNKEKFVCLDITGSDPFAALRYIKLCDVFYFSVQKYFSLLPGLCVFCMNNNARKISEYIDENFSRNKFLNLVDHLAFAAKNQTLYTINTMGVYLFNKQLDRLLNRYNEYKYAHVVNFNYLKNRVDASETLKYMIPQKSLSSNIIKILCSKSYQEIKNVLHTNNVLVSSLNEEDNNSCSFRINNYMIRKKSDFHKLIDLIE
jgi:aspartate aminotransferase-like enzyme